MRKPPAKFDVPLPIIVGCVIGVMLIGVALLGQERRSLVDVFDKAPTPELPALFANFGDVSQQAVASWLSDGSSLPAVTPQAVGPRIAVHVDRLRRVGTVLEIRGTIFNKTSTPLSFSVDNIRFVDAEGNKYENAAPNPSLTLETTAPFAFQIPVPPSRMLTMTVTYDPDPPLVITLLQERSTP